MVIWDDIIVSSVVRRLSYDFVRMEGLEPPRLAAPDPKSGAATNYATCACLLFLPVFRLKSMALNPSGLQK